jgi:hypothetical protein
MIYMRVGPLLSVLSHVLSTSIPIWPPFQVLGKEARGGRFVPLSFLHRVALFHLLGYLIMSQLFRFGIALLALASTAATQPLSVKRDECTNPRQVKSWLVPPRAMHKDSRILSYWFTT